MKITSWTDLVVDASPVNAIFGHKPPSFDAIELHEIILHRDGPRALLRFDLRDFPASPPKKWSSAGFNRVQMRLLASGVRKLQITGLQSKIQADLSISRDGSLIRVHVDNGEVRLELTAECVIVDGITAYRESN